MYSFVAAVYIQVVKLYNCLALVALNLALMKEGHTKSRNYEEPTSSRPRLIQRKIRFFKIILLKGDFWYWYTYILFDTPRYLNYGYRWVLGHSNILKTWNWAKVKDKDGKDDNGFFVTWTHSRPPPPECDICHTFFLKASLTNYQSFCNIAKFVNIHVTLLTSPAMPMTHSNECFHSIQLNKNIKSLEREFAISS